MRPSKWSSHGLRASLMTSAPATCWRNSTGREPRKHREAFGNPCSVGHNPPPERVIAHYEVIVFPSFHCLFCGFPFGWLRFGTSAHDQSSGRSTATAGYDECFRRLSGQSDYRIGAQDLLEIAVFGVPDLSRTVRV